MHARLQQVLIALVTLTLLTPGLTAQDTPAAPEPVRVMLIGSSSMRTDIGVVLRERLEEMGGFEVNNAARSATGLARLDHFDWLTHAREQADAFQPQVVLGQFGGNDCQALILADETVEARFGDDNWGEVYGARVTQLVNDLQARGAEVIFVGMPNMRSNRFAGRIQIANGVVEQAVTAAGGRYISIWDISSNSDGSFRATFEQDGRTRDMREDDGIHFTRRGAMFVTDYLLEQIASE